MRGMRAWSAGPMGECGREIARDAGIARANGWLGVQHPDCAGGQQAVVSPRVTTMDKTKKAMVPSMQHPRPKFSHTTSKERMGGGVYILLYF
jgi:hypothetical protein